MSKPKAASKQSKARNKVMHEMLTRIASACSMDKKYTERVTAVDLAAKLADVRKIAAEGLEQLAALEDGSGVGASAASVEDSDD